MSEPQLKAENKTLSNSISQITELSKQFGLEMFAVAELRTLLREFQEHSNKLLKFVNNAENDKLTTSLTPAPASNFSLLCESVETIEYYLQNSLYDLQETEGKIKNEYAEKVSDLLD